MERILPIEGGFNFRELGNYPTLDGFKTKEKRLIRAATLDKLTAKDQDFLSQYGVKQVLDFRSQRELDRAKDQEIPGAKNIFNPIFEENDEPENLDLIDFYEFFIGDLTGVERMKKSYEEFIYSEHSKKAYHDFFSYLIQNETGASLFHCSSGKDRTGFGAFLVLSALNVPEEVIWEDYLITNTQVTGKIQRVLTLADEKNASEYLKNQISDLLVVKEEYLKHSLHVLNQEYGDVHHYLRQGLGLAESDLRDFQKQYRE